jgi:uridine phosphorylase
MASNSLRSAGLPKIWSAVRVLIPGDDARAKRIAAKSDELQKGEESRRLPVRSYQLPRVLRLPIQASQSA